MVINGDMERDHMKQKQRTYSNKVVRYIRKTHQVGPPDRSCPSAKSTCEGTGTSWDGWVAWRLPLCLDPSTMPNTKATYWFPLACLIGGKIVFISNKGRTRKLWYLKQEAACIHEVGDIFTRPWHARAPKKPVSHVTIYWSQFNPSHLWNSS